MTHLKGNRSFWFGFFSGILAVVAAGFLLFIWLFYFYTIHPEPPLALNKNLVVTEVVGGGFPAFTVVSEPCEETDYPHLEAASSHGQLRTSANLEIPDHRKNNCTQYPMADGLTLIDYMPGMMGTLILKSEQQGTTTFTPIFTSKGEYPARYYTLAAVTDHEMYFEYGGYEYFGNDTSGQLLYKINLMED